MTRQTLARVAGFFVLGCVVGLFLPTSIAAPATPAPEERKAQQNFRRGIIVGDNQVGTGIARITQGTLTYNFPALTSTSTAVETICAYSTAVTVKGLRFGDVCSVGLDQAPPSANGTVDVHVTAAGSAKVQACAVGITDGGSFDMPDATYSVLCFGAL